jgi:hypothetical protein
MAIPNSLNSIGPQVLRLNSQCRPLELLHWQKMKAAAIFLTSLPLVSSPKCGSLSPDFLGISEKFR